MEKETAEKAVDLNEFLSDETNGRKEGKAETGRLAIHMAHQFLEIIEEAEEEEKEDVKDVLNVKRRMVDIL